MTINFNNLQNDFQERSKEVSNTHFFIQNELKQIDKFLYHTDFTPRGNNNIFIPYRYESEIDTIQKVYNLVKYGWSTFLSAYKEYCYNEVEVLFKPLETIFNDTQEETDKRNKEYIEYHNQGIEFAKYFLWLKKSENSNTTRSKKQPVIPHKQKMLVLYYLGLDVSDYDNNKVAKVLSKVLDLNEDNTRKYLSYVHTGTNDVRTLKNLNAVKTLFDKNNLKEISNQIQEDIDSIK